MCVYLVLNLIKDFLALRNNDAEKPQ
jgi:hypothetical protein